MLGKRCCTFFVGGVVSGVYSTAAYLAAFCMEVGWLVEYQGDLPAPSYVLTAVYFSTLLVSSILLIGIAKKRSRFLLIWLFFMGVMFLPECALVLYMVLRYWLLTNNNGITELTFYIFRAVVNVLAFVSVQSLLRRWKQEKAVMKRLEFLNINVPPREMNGYSKPENELSVPNGQPHSQMNSYPIGREVDMSRMHRHPANTPVQPNFTIMPISSYFSNSEFDAASFIKHMNSRSRVTVSEIGPSPHRHQYPSHNYYNFENGSPGYQGYATQSLERPKFRAEPFGKRSRSMEDIRRADEVTLEKIQEQPFQYLNRPGGYYRDDSDNSDTHSIRDIAL